LFFFTQAAQTAIDQFWSQGILGAKETEITTRMWYMMGVVKNLLISMTWKKT
jgi:hypothetical protein